jgi:YggT family protein
VIFAVVETGLRWLVLAALAYGVVIGVTHWAVRTRRLQPFGALPRAVRRVSDPVLIPFERRVMRLGGNPQDAPLWLLGAIVLFGLVLITLVRWLRDWWFRLQVVGQGGPEIAVLTLVDIVFNLLRLAIFVRVIGSWLGAGRYNRWMRPFYIATDWLIEPLRRVLPPLGPIDISPFVAYLALLLLQPFVMGLLRRLLLG